MNSVISNIRNFEDRLRRKLLLHSETVMLVRSNLQVSQSWQYRRIRSRRTERGAKEEIRGCTCRNHTLSLVDRLQQKERQNIAIHTAAGSLRLIENTEATAEYCSISNWLPRKPDTRSKLRAIGIGDGVGKTRLAACLNVLPKELISGGSGILGCQINLICIARNNNWPRFSWIEGTQLSLVSVLPGRVLISQSKIHR